MSVTIRDVYNDITDAIRTCNGSSNTYTPAQMPDAIRELNNPLSGITVELASVWTSGTDNDVLLMVQAANKGTIDLTDYWSVGDTRSASLSAMSATEITESYEARESHEAQTVEMVLMHANPNCYTYVTTPASGRTKPYFIYGQKNCLVTDGYMNSFNNNNGSWDGCARRRWCNNVYRRAVPAYLRTITKRVNVITAQTYNGSTNKTSQDYFFLAAAKEVFGGTATTAGMDTGMSNLTEYQALEQWTWYATSANRIKKIGTSGANTAWWERSPSYQYNNIFLCVYPGGGAGGTNPNATFWLVPHGCI